MISKEKIKFLRSLQQKKYRDKEQLYLAEGLKIVKELLIFQPKNVAEIYLADNFNADDIPGLKNFKQCSLISANDLKKISALKTPPGVLAIVKFNVNNKPDFTSDITLMLDRVQDPGNLGTIIRIADWFGIKQIVCSPDSVDCYNPKVVQSTMGAIFRVQVSYADLAEILKENSGKVISYATSLEGDNIYQSTLKTPSFILMGNESKGLSEELMDFADNKLKIPSFVSDGVTSESLNVSVATGIICSEFRRRG